ncbi:MAG: succinylglutamate desuccinylase/aspartoacylase family protein [Deltaproteobacteria bacterium]|nr:succinylglutamate desuccinylase/aspartoacylase family protein [Deltaproteobacteria bacterium]
MKKLSIYTLVTVFFLMFFIGNGFCKTEHEVYFKDTPYELNVYKIYGTEKGNTLMIIGGIQGDEPGGYLSADLYADMALRKGNLIVVPRANFLSIIKHKRAINWDMNRRFAPINNKNYYEDKIVEILKDLMAQSDYLLNLHEGSGFFLENWESDLKNPMRFGQSIIADADIYYSKEKGADVLLGDTARKIAGRVNEMIDNKQHHFRFNNHRTFEKNTGHPEQKRSATFYALSTYGIPAFGIEISKEIKDIETKVRMQTMVINSFMNEFGIISENPKVALVSPKLKYLIVSVNGLQNILVRDGGEIKVRKGDRIKISQIEANYERGLSVDIIGKGTANDYNKEFEIEGPTKAFIRKDNLKCGEVNISVADSKFGVLTSKLNDSNNYAEVLKEQSAKPPKFQYIILEVNGLRQVLSNAEHLKIIKGDGIRLLDVVAQGVNAGELTVNFLGFVGNKIKNSGEDRGYLINTAKDLWVKYSKSGKDLEYMIAINYKDKKFGEVFIDIEEPKLNYIVVRHGQGGQRWYANGDTISVTVRDVLEVVDIKTNVNGNIGVKVNVSGAELSGKNKVITFNKNHTANRNDAIVITREGMIIGKAKIQIGEAVTAKNRNLKLGNRN